MRCLLYFSVVLQFGLSNIAGVMILILGSKMRLALHSNKVSDDFANRAYYAESASAIPS